MCNKNKSLILNSNPTVESKQKEWEKGEKGRKSVRVSWKFREIRFVENKLKFKQLYTEIRRASTRLQYGFTMANAGAGMGSQALSHQWLSWWQWLNVWLTTKWWLKSTSWTRHITQRGASWGTCMDATNWPNKVCTFYVILCYFYVGPKEKTLNHLNLWHFISVKTLMEKGSQHKKISSMF